MNIIRKYKLSKLTGINYLSETEKQIIDFVFANISNLTEFNYDKFSKARYYMNMDGKCMFKYNTTTKNLYVAYQGFWEILRYKYNLGYNDIQYIMKYLVELLYKLDIKETLNSGINLLTVVETSYRKNKLCNIV